MGFFAPTVLIALDTLLTVSFNVFNESTNTEPTMQPTTFKSTLAVRVGDVIRAPIPGGFAQVKALTPYTGPLLDILGEGSTIASFHGTPVEMTLPAVGWAEVQI